MARIFVSHSGANNDWAMRVRDWLVENGWPDIFLDLHPTQGIAPGKRWLDELRRSTHRCEVVLALLSHEWLASSWCKAEVNAARLLGKKIIVALIGLPKSEIPVDLTEEQWVDLQNDPDGFFRLRMGLAHAGLDPSTFPFEEGRRPYPGFLPLEENDAAIFFGRDAQIVDAIDKMRTIARNGVKPLLIILGASGAGKSSFLRAGLWPRLKRDDMTWLPIPTIRPERAVITGEFGLVRALEQIAVTEPFSGAFSARGLPRARGDIIAFLEQEQNGFAQILSLLQSAAQESLNAASGAKITLILPIDQGEELFNSDGASEARKFSEMLSRALSSLGPDVTALVLISLRSDSLPRLQEGSLFAELAKEFITLDPMLQGSYRAVIEGPALLVRPKPLKIDPLLTDALLRNLGGQDALPLLAFTLQRLLQNFGANGELTHDDYESIGGLQGVIEGAVEEAFADTDEHRGLSQDKTQRLALLRKLFVPHLARVNDAREFIRQVAIRDNIPKEVHGLVDRMADCRLLVTDRRSVDNSDVKLDVVEVAHEALLREWRDLHDLLLAEKEFLVAKGHLEQEVKYWRDAPIANRSSSLLAGSRLARARLLLADRSDDLTAEEREFIQLSITQAEKSRRRAKWLVTAALILISAFATFAVIQRNAAEAQKQEAVQQRAIADDNAKQAKTDKDEADRQRRIANDRAREAEAERHEAERQSGIALENAKEAEAALRESRARQARLLADQARREYRVGNSTVALLLALESLPETASTDSNARPYVSEAEAALLEVLGTQRPVRIPASAHGVTAIGFSPDGKILVAGLDDGEVVLWDTASGAKLRTLVGHNKEISSVRFNRAGTLVLTASRDNSARLWDVKDGRSLSVFMGESPALFAQLSDDETRVIVTHGDLRDSRERDVKLNQVRLYTLSNPRSFDYQVAGFSGKVLRAYLSADNSKGLLIACYIYLWDFPNRLQIGLGGHGEGCARDASYSPTDEIIAVIFNYVHEAHLYKAGNIEQVGVLQGALEKINSIEFSPGGRLLATSHGNELIGSKENVARIWSYPSLKPLHILKGHRKSVMNASFTSNGRLLITASYEGVLRQWDVESGKLLSEFTDDKKNEETEGGEFALSPNGQYAAFDDAKAIRIWRIRPDLQALIDEARTRAPRCLSQAERIAFDLEPEIPAWCVAKHKWPTTESKTVSAVDPLLRLMRSVAELDLKPKHLPNDPCVSNPRYGPLLRLQNIYVQVQNEYLDYWPDIRLLLAEVSREPTSMLSIQTFMERFSGGEYREFYQKNHIGTLTDYLIQYHDKYKRLPQRQKEVLGMAEFEREEKNIVIQLPTPDNPCLSKIGITEDPSGTFESLDEWFYAFWLRRENEGNDAVVLSILKLVKKIYQ